jgi:hypothetical protein
MFALFSQSLRGVTVDRHAETNGDPIVRVDFGYDLTLRLSPEEAKEVRDGIDRVLAELGGK